MVWVREWRIREDFSCGNIPLNIIININIDDKEMLFILLFRKEKEFKTVSFEKEINILTFQVA